VESDIYYNTQEIKDWFDNDKNLYKYASIFMKKYNKKNPYKDFINKFKLYGKKVPYKDFNWENVDFDEMGLFMEKFEE
jgi:DNA polymerase sigma